MGQSGYTIPGKIIESAQLEDFIHFIFLFYSK